MTSMTSYSQSGNDEIDFILKKGISARKWILPSTNTITWSTIKEPNTGVMGSNSGITDPGQLERINSVLSRYSEVANVNFLQVDATSTPVADLKIYNMRTEEYNGVAVANPGDPYATIGLRLDKWDQYQSWQVTAHEVGHILGLSHIHEKINNEWIYSPNSIKYNVADTVMAYNHTQKWYYENQSDPEDLGIYDIAAIQYLYGANTSFNSGDTTYRYSYVPFHNTIWDGGGNDTIDLSNFTIGSNLNLNNGTRSDIFFRPVDGVYAEHFFMGERALGIAYGANIENARGTQGNDTITGNDLNNTIRGESGNDLIYGNAGNDYLDGGAGNDTLDGGLGNDTLDGGTGSDTMFGGAGNDIYYVDSAGDTVTENSNEGIDTVNSSISFTLGSNIENLTLTGSSSINGFGNNLNNTILGNGYDNVLFGNAGNDVMQGFGGHDTLYGGDGNDTLYGDAGGDLLYGGNGNDQYNIFDASASIIEYQSEGIDTITICSDSILSHKMTDNLENFSSPSLENNISIVGNDLSNSIRIGNGNNVITGGKGDDILSGGGGSDTYIFNRGDGFDRIQEAGKDVASSKTDVDVLQFGEGINFDQLWFSKESLYGTLAVGVIGTTDKISIEFWYPNQQTNWSEHYIERFQTSDGKTLSLGKVDQLVNAMAAFSPPELGQTTLPSNYQQTLAPVIAAAWS